MARPDGNDATPHGMWLERRSRRTGTRLFVRMSIALDGMEYRAAASVAKHGVSGAVARCLERVPLTHPDALASAYERHIRRLMRAEKEQP